MKHVVVTIDGFAGVGKSTVAKKVAERLSFVHLNSGAIFRAIALKTLNSGLKTSEKSDVSKVVSEIDLSLKQVLDNTNNSVLQVVLDGRVVSAELFDETIGKGASEVAKFVDVRDCACRLQRNVAETSSIVAEGRDAGTLIFPDADFKFFLTTSVEVAARRRLCQLRPDIVEELKRDPEKFQKELSQIQVAIAARNLIDATNEIAPTVKAKDAIEIDTLELSADEVANRIVQIVNPQLEKNC